MCPDFAYVQVDGKITFNEDLVLEEVGDEPEASPEPEIVDLEPELEKHFNAYEDETATVDDNSHKQHSNQATQNISTENDVVEIESVNISNDRPEENMEKQSDIYEDMDSDNGDIVIVDEVRRRKR